MSENFDLEKSDRNARAGVLHTRRGDIKTPVFMPVATRGAIKGAVDFNDLSLMGFPVCLSNTYHLFLRPGSDLIAKFGGLHDFMKWEKPILTDSGGFQVFSIRQKKITDEGVYFNAHIDGKRFYIDAEKSIAIQHQLGSDIIMAFDECPPGKLDNPTGLSAEKLERKLYFRIKKAVNRTTQWAYRSIKAHQKRYGPKLSPLQRPQIFGIVQGGCFSDLRKKSLSEITAMDFDGFAMGGLAVGEPVRKMYEVLEEIVPQMPEDKPRYLMGVGTPVDLLESVSRGIDMFDCVLPSRNARHGLCYTWKGIVKISHLSNKYAKEVIDQSCGCSVCRGGFSRGYLHHLIKVGENLGKRYLTIHNLYFYQDLMRNMRKNILAGTFDSWKEKYLKRWRKR